MHITHTYAKNTGYLHARTITLFPGDSFISVPTIHHKALNMQIILISVLGDRITYSNVSLYLNSPSFIFISLIQDRPSSSINTGAHADRRSQGPAIGWSYCHSSLAYIFYRAEEGDTGLRNKHLVPHHTDIQSNTLRHMQTHCSQQCASVSPVSECGRDRPGTLSLFILECMYLWRPGGKGTGREGKMR